MFLVGRPTLFWGGAWLLLVIGCGPKTGDRIAPPAYSADEAARKALEEYDTNKDGFIAGEELDRCPALKSSLATLDKDGDGRISQTELADRLRAHQETKTGLFSVMCQVTLDGSPLAGATVTFVPEKFLGPNFKPAAGLTDGDGWARLQVEGASLPGVPHGFYRVEVTKKDSSGQGTLPPRYHARTELGQEVGPRVAGLHGGVKLQLSSGQ